MSSNQAKSEKFHPDNALPEALRRRFERDGKLPRAEIDAFRDRLLATCPSEVELAQVATAENPWEVLGRLELRPIPESVTRRVKRAQKELNDALTAPVPWTATADKPPAPVPDRDDQPARAAADDPMLAVLRGYSAERIEMFVANFRKTRGVDPSVEDPTTVLRGRDREVYIAMSKALKEARLEKRA